MSSDPDYISGALIIVGGDVDPALIRKLAAAGARVEIATLEAIDEMLRTGEALGRARVARDEQSPFPDALAFESFRRPEEKGPDLARRRQDASNLREQLKRKERRGRKGGGRGKR